MAKKQSFFDFFSIFSKFAHTIRTKASQKEKDLSRLLYRICGSGLTYESETSENFNFYRIREFVSTAPEIGGILTERKKNNQIAIKILFLTLFLKNAGNQSNR